ncbi:MAG: hypothetical protein CMC63_10175 [Flavobacteriaceae bacterium]|nr:hypothetical protein [Flavobacteriaceae bacterium]|tara:strand:+ start:73 stop:450 length:378 start_codon:yes stop_codon:yes gene_type:complete
MSSLLKAFNNHLLEFVEDVIRIFPENLDIKTGKTFIEGIKRVNPKKIITYWRDNILNLYEREITEGDISFFVNKDYRNDIGTESQSLKVLEDIRKLVKKTTQENKEKAMKYIQNLTKICKLYFND